MGTTKHPPGKRLPGAEKNRNRERGKANAPIKTRSRLFGDARLGVGCDQSHAQTLTTLTSFNSSGGIFPRDSLTLSGSTLYGTTINGGPNGNGTVFSLPVTGGTPTTLGSFNNSTNGSVPDSNLTLSGSTFYGTTYNGGAAGDGTVFSIPMTGGTPTTLASFNSSSGANPNGGVTLGGSTLYGMAWTGGANNDGTIFSVPVTGGTPTTLFSFDGTRVVALQQYFISHPINPLWGNHQSRRRKQRRHHLQRSRNRRHSDASWSVTTTTRRRCSSLMAI